MKEGISDYVFRVPLRWERTLKVLIFLVWVVALVILVKSLQQPTSLFLRLGLAVFVFFWTLLFCSDVFLRPWISLRATIRGCFLRIYCSRLAFLNVSEDDDFLFVPWAEIGKIYLVRDEERSPSICLELRVSDDQWFSLHPWENKVKSVMGFVVSKPDADGYRQHRITNNFQDVALVIEALEQRRLGSVAVSSGSAAIESQLIKRDFCDTNDE